MGKPFIKLLHTINAGYFYDVNRNQLVDVSEKGYQYLQDLLADKEVGTEPEEIQNFKKKGYLSDHHVKVIEHAESPYLEPLLNRRVYSITLQVTQACNFRCSYCIYNDVESNIGQRKHSSEVMEFDIAEKALEFLRDHSIDCHEVNIGFYGGEPLLQFELVQKLVDSAEAIFRGKPCTFSITTNGSLLQGEVLDYLVAHRVGINISLDGPQKIHDANRVFQGSRLGTYEVVHRNIRAIKEKYPDYLQKIFVHMVIDPKNDFDEINDFINSPDMKGIKVTVALLDDHYSSTKHPMTMRYQEKYQYHFFLALLAEMRRANREDVSQIAREMLMQILKKNDALLGKAILPDMSSPSGQCIPGEQKLFCDVHGNFYPCERVSELAACMNIGNVYNGFNLNQVYELLNMAQITEQECRKCSAFLHCSLCISTCEKGGVIDRKARLFHCDAVRRQMEMALKCSALLKEYKKYYKRGVVV